MWYKDWAKVYDTDHFTDSGKTIYFDDKQQLERTYNWWQSPEFWHVLQENLHSIKHIYLVGGEPTIIEQHYEFLQMLVDAGVSENITLEYDTNLTNVHTRSLDLWKNFKKLFLRLSVDDYGEQNDYIRYPSKWHIIERNISTLRNSIPDLRLEVSLTWQVLNAFTFINLLDFFKHDEVSIRILSTPEFLDCAWLPKSAKQDLIALYKQHSVPEHLINYLQEAMGDYDKQLHQQFLSFCDKLDTIRGTSWRTIFVDLDKYIQGDLL
jgi:sulfatase maturation enzyme AslB (radical SAM superfamily)